MAHLYRALVSFRILILAGTLTLAAAGAAVAVGQGHPAMQAAATSSCISNSVTTVPFTYLIAHWSTSTAPCATAAGNVESAAVAPTGFVRYVPFTYLVQQWG